mmetsp:Transcript_96620/g.251872  ORF Transcript_96620/g.251872 Transcript_96620/m.251872 type:complete len:228 (+) Transcript_96620:1269-1952(+)
MCWLLLFLVRAGRTALHTHAGRLWNGLCDLRFRGLGLFAFLQLVFLTDSSPDGPLPIQAARSPRLLRPRCPSSTGVTTLWNQAHRLGRRGSEARHLQQAQAYGVRRRRQHGRRSPHCERHQHRQCRIREPGRGTRRSPQTPTAQVGSGKRHRLYTRPSSHQCRYRVWRRISRAHQSHHGRAEQHSRADAARPERSARVRVLRGMIERVCLQRSQCITRLGQKHLILY